MATSLAIPAAVLMVISLLVLPLPAFMLDIFFTFNIILALLIIMVAINTSSPMDFSSFPMVILFATVLRLGLNVASTRVVLLEGHQGGDAAGKVIEAFGQFVIGGNYAVGFIVFAILMIINFIVITKGAGRISEVIARFTLDALPGKQMAIDADLNAGVIDQETAKQRREQVAQESDFFGSMDGASKFVRGDAVAAILILLINLVGGLTIGMLQHDLSFNEATRAYILLTIGDGLVATIPALVLSLATAIIVARVTTDESAPEQATKQLGNPLAFGLAGGTLTLLGLIPGMPNAVFLSLGLSAIGLSYALKKMGVKKIEQDARDELVQETSKEVLDLDWDDAGQVDVIGIELGYGLIPLIDESHDGKLLQRTKGIRKKLSSDFGFLLPTIRIRDNLDSAPNNYKIVLNGSSRGSGQIEMGKELAINPGQVLEEVDGIKTQDPAFGLEAVWINEGDKEYAQAVGYTVVDPSTVIATHLNSILRANADEFMTFDIAQEMLDRIGEQSPKMLEELIPEQLPLSSFVKILQNLLAEGVPLRDMRTLLETVSEGVANTKDPEALTAMVRIRLGRLIVQEASQEQVTLEVLTLDPGLEQLLSDLVRSATSIDEVALEPNLSESFFSAISQSIKQLEETEKEAVLVVSPILRPWLAKLLRRASQEVKVLSYREVPDDQSIKIIQTIELEEKSENGVEE
ncbi:MAG: flagellar biosynthesis protein FlhA [Pseudomonadota bacterium]|nr:flagellar biosynthesis protein FlhA [Pseudomonadota bacterium]